jgi:hypothetical protein
MKYFISFVICTAIVFLRCQGQDENVFKRLHGTIIKENLFLRNNGVASFQYKIDNETNWYDVKKGKFYNVRNNHDNTIGVYIKFYNPLKYKFKSSFKDVDDPINQSLSQFLSSFPSMETIIPKIDGSPAVSEKQNDAFKKAAIKGNEKPNTIEPTIVLFQWVYEFIRSVDFVDIKSDSAKKNSYNTLVNYINGETKSIDDYLYRKITITLIDHQETESFIQLLNTRKAKLFNSPSDYEFFLAEINNSKKATADIWVSFPKNSTV